jgi:hypothetical protein
MDTEGREKEKWRRRENGREKEREVSISVGQLERGKEQSRA